MVTRWVRHFQGENIEETIERLTEEMMTYARKYEFEKAASIRDFIEELKNIKDWFCFLNFL